MTVTVHQFEVWDIQDDRYVVQPHKGTSERIAEAKGRIILGTAEQVADMLVDAAGRYIG